MPAALLRIRLALSRAGWRVRGRALAIAQTAGAALAAYYLAVLAPLDDPQPVFASIAAVISLGASQTRYGRRAFELTAGVVLGLVVADLLLYFIGTGPLQIAFLIVLVMALAVALGAGELVIVESAVSALLIASLQVTSDISGFSPDRLIEAVIGGGVALAVGALVFPRDPALLVSRAAQDVVGDLGRTLERVADALAAGDPARAEDALVLARGGDARIATLEDSLADARETARVSPARRSARAALEPYVRTLPHLEFATRNTDVLARHALRYSRSRLVAPDGLTQAVRRLADAVWALGAAYDDERRVDAARGAAVEAAALAREVFETEPDLALTEIVSQVRSAAVDLMRAAELVDGDAKPVGEMPTEELLAAGR